MLENNRKCGVSDETRAKISLAGKGKKRSEETRAKISKARRGMKFSTESRSKMSLAKKGKCFGENNTFYGKHHTEKTKEKISEAKIGQLLSVEHKQHISEGVYKAHAENPSIAVRISKSHTGVPKGPFSDKHCESIAKSAKQRWDNLVVEKRKDAYLEKSLFGLKAQYGRSQINREVLGRKISVVKTGVPNSPSHCESMSRAMKRQWADPVFAKKMADTRGWKPTTPEIFLAAILDEYFPDVWEYTGSGKGLVAVGHKYPDFVRKDGKKEIIEVFGNYWHNPKYFPNKLSEDDLVAYYGKFGFGCVVFWEDEVYYEEKVLRKLGRLDQ